MSEPIDESGRNPTQRRMDEEDASVPVDASWDPERQGELEAEPPSDPGSVREGDDAGSSRDE